MFINMNLGAVTEPKPVASGRYGLTIATAKYREEKPDIELSIGIDGHIEAPNIRHWISLPKKDDEPSKAQFKQLMLKRFLKMFGIPYDEAQGFNTDDFAGAHCASAQVKLGEPNDSGNVYNELALDKMPNEGTVADAAAVKS